MKKILMILLVLSHLLCILLGYCLAKVDLFAPDALETEVTTVATEEPDAPKAQQETDTTEPVVSTEESFVESNAATEEAEESQETAPPTTQAPTMQPSATEPPATQPPMTEPPTTEPPVTNPPATEPPAIQPPAENIPGEGIGGGYETDRD